MNVLSKLLRLRAGGDVKRYHTFPTIGNQTVGHHSHNVVTLLLHLHPNPSRELLIAANYHDLAEYDTGDCPANVKWAHPDMVTILERAEARVETTLGIHVELNDEDKQWLKLCDTLEYCLYALEQRYLGNQNMGRVFTRGMCRFDQGRHPLVDEYPHIGEFLGRLKVAFSQATSGYAPEDYSVEGI